MKRSILAFVASFLAAMLVFAAAPVAANASSIAATGVDDFEFASFHAVYQLDRDETGHSILRTQETLVANFPQYDQNRGIKRAIPNHYRDIDTRLEILSVTDEAGLARKFTVETDGAFDVVTIAVPEGQYVHGPQTYVIEYTQRDVTAFFENTGRDEFYWDINGTGWRQPFHQVSAELHIAGDLADALTDDTACYQGADGSTESCTILRTDESEGTGAAVTYVATPTRGLDPHENMTIAVGFEPGTFAEAQPGFVQRFAPWLTALPFGTALLLGALVLLLSLSTWRDAPRRRAVIAQYEPPAGIDVFLAAELWRSQKKAAVASLIDLSVRGNTRLLQHDIPLTGYPGITVGAVHRTPGAYVRTAPVFGVQALTDSGLTPAERTFASMLFPPRLVPEAVRWFDRADNKLAERIIAWRTETGRRVTEQGLRRRPSTASYMPVIALIALTALAQAVGLYALVERIERDAMLIAPALLGFTGTTAVVFLSIYVFRKRPLTAQGREILDHLRGLELFIRLAEADRIRMLQTPSGAERIPVAQGAIPAGHVGAFRTGMTTETSVSIIRVYERLLPYAILFGFERHWFATLAHYYREAQPEWMIFGRPDMPLRDFAESLGGFVTSMSTSYSGSDSSSGSGGSGGGGSSGGGGGGGGGGGV